MHLTQTLSRSRVLPFFGTLDRRFLHREMCMQGDFRGSTAHGG